MKLNQAIFIIATPLLFEPYATANADALKEYSKTISQVNDELAVFESDAGFCPGVKLALSCGDEVCDAQVGENESTCPTDCLRVPIHSYNSQTFCKDVKEVLKPKTTKDVLDAVKNAVEQNSHVRVIGKAHSTNSQLCSNGVVMSTESLNHILGIETFEGYETVLLEPGVSEQELTNFLHEHKKSIGYGLVGFRGISVGGLTATGAHGSSPKHSAMLSSAIQSIKMVTAEGKLVEYSEKTTDPELFKALRTHLGMFGVVVQLRLRLRSQFSLDTEIEFATEDLILNGKPPADLVKDCDFGQIHWFPSTKKIMKTCGVETTKATDPGAENIYLDPYIPKELKVPYKVAFHYGACSASFNALFETLRFTVAKWQPPLVKLNGENERVNTTHAIGPSHLMLSSELGLGRETLIIRDWEVAVPQSHIASALVAIKNYMAEHHLSLPVTGFFLRFTPVEETTLIANATADGHFKTGEIVTFVEFPAYYPIGFSVDERERYARLYEGMITMLVEQFHGRPHWGKNDEAIFAAHNKTGNEQNIIARFKHWVEIADPKGVFTNDFYKLITAPQPLIKKAAAK